MIRSLELRGFRIFRDARIGLGDRTLVLGNNGAGKSSLSDALSYLATGACRGTTSDGKGLESLVRVGEREMLVTAQDDEVGAVGRGRIERMLERGPRRGESNLEPHAHNTERLLETRGVSARQWALAVRPDAFLSLGERDQAAVLCELAGVPELSVEALLGAGCPDTVRRYEAPLDGTLSGYIACEELARKARLQAGRRAEQAKGAYETARDECSAPRGESDGAAVSEVDLQRARLARQSAVESVMSLERAELQARSQHDGRVRERRERVERLERQIGKSAPAGEASPSTELRAGSAPTEEREQKVADLAAARAACDDRSPASIQDEIAGLGLRGRSTATIRGDATAATGDAERAEERARQITERLEEIGDIGPEPKAPEGTEEFDRLHRLVRSAEADSPACYACGQAIDLDTLKDQLTRLDTEVAAHERAREAWDLKRMDRDGLLSQQRQIAAANHPQRIADAERAVELAVQRDALEEKLGHARRAVELEAAVKRLDAQITEAERDPERREERQRLEADLADARVSLESLGEFVSPVADELASARTRAESAKAEVSRLTALAEAAAQRAAEQAGLVARRDELKRAWDSAAGEHGELNALVSALAGPVRQELFAGPLERLTEELADAMYCLGWFLDDGKEREVYRASVSLDDSGKLELRLGRNIDGSMVDLPMECCSESERLRVRWALQWLAAQRARIIVLDSPEALDARFAQAPYLFADWAAHGGVQAIVLSTRPRAKLPDGWTVVELADGDVVLRDASSGGSSGQPGGEQAAEREVA